MSTSGSSRTARASLWLQRGHALEADGTTATLVDAVAAYDAIIGMFDPPPIAFDIADLRTLGGAWMNRGNALQKLGTPEHLEEAVHAYDEAIRILGKLPVAAHAPYRNVLGTAWMNRGHALLQFSDPARRAEAIASLVRAVEILGLLPIDDVPAYALNLAGAEINLANALLLAPNADDAHRAKALARDALGHVGSRERTSIEFADLGLKARRAWCAAIGEIIIAPDANQSELAHEASDLVDDGIALARRWEEIGFPRFRPLRARLFRFGAQLYRLHQPQFLAEFLAEQAGVIRDPDFDAVALENIDAVLRARSTNKILVAGDPASERRREMAAALFALRDQILKARSATEAFAALARAQTTSSRRPRAPTCLHDRS